MAITKNENQLVHCAHCNSARLHQRTVDIYNRVEGDRAGYRTTVDFDRVNTVNSQAGNPSPRRQGLVIALICEDCSQVSVMTVAQQKGCTFLNVDKAPEQYRHLSDSQMLDYPLERT
ncbi:hypothetical protein LRP52_28850 [Photobacterium sp. ZSDE20]|uniref:Uncharacterized protein n=1 Tax=Photobacterium pectinilyticum TaxID=2906793 RepID=A0ABT1NBN4_9GAMM|nr:hypothetical protein [Photobacterium sp. ZSDE20]MCQ1061091.1 hypothetical protein [Photobacterium sp. ZSDE20]MDD1826190.1 hypothetical protein [Photobacterium sp. ZSDE20]